MIHGIRCSETMWQALLALPKATYRRVEAALRRAFLYPEWVQDYGFADYAPLKVHALVSADVLFVLGDTQSEFRLLQVTLFAPDGSHHTIH
ncbi:MAG TPA: hypothetical protein VMS43_02885 [Allosphingosinicella sp.]|nr:hypothetical protein [Allosphingosinicella sp.]